MPQKKAKAAAPGGGEITGEITGENRGQFSDRNDPRRGKGGARPGAGRKPKEVNEIRRMLILDAEKARRRLKKLMNQEENLVVACDAAKTLLAHGVGRPKQGIEVDATMSPVLGPDDESAMVLRARQLGLGNMIPARMLERERQLAAIATSATIAAVVAFEDGEDGES